MMRALVERGLRDQRRAPLTWGGSLGAMGALVAAIWPSIEDTASELIEQYPEGLKEAFGIGELDSVEKYVDAEMLSFIVPLALAFFAVRCVSRMTVGAEEHHYLDTLLSAPVSRRALVVSSFAVTALMSVAILAVVWLLTWLGAALVGAGLDAGTLAEGMINVWPLAMFFAGLATFAGGFAHKQTTVTAIATATLAAMYIVDLAGKLADELEPLRTLSAFRYYGSAINEGIDLSHFAGLTAVAVLLAAAGTTLFERRDIL
jgi:ABC-2 type transport system permease protein